MQKFLIAFGLFFVFNLTLSAQSPESLQITNTRHASSSSAVLQNPDRAFYADQESKTIFIDFENLNVNLSNIVVKDILGGVVFKAEVGGLPVDTIYELDMSRMTSGTYEIELRSYTGVIRKTVTMP
jgi:hypothetical protein